MPKFCGGDGLWLNLSWVVVVMGAVKVSGGNPIPGREGCRRGSAAMVQTSLFLQRLKSLRNICPVLRESTIKEIGRKSGGPLNRTLSIG
jgi:hypothetical protein